jgi:hypothetical protein
MERSIDSARSRRVAGPDTGLTNAGATRIGTGETPHAKVHPPLTPAAAAPRLAVPSTQTPENRANTRIGGP